MLGSRLYNNMTRYNPIMGNIAFLALYTYISGIYLFILLEGWEVVIQEGVFQWRLFNPVVIWKSLYYHWNHWWLYKDQLDAGVWTRLFGAATLPFFTLRIVEIVGHFLLWLVLSIFGLKLLSPEEAEMERIKREREAMTEELKQEIRQTIHEEMQQEMQQKLETGSTASPPEEEKK